jgi:hypothetical protein
LTRKYNYPFKEVELRTGCQRCIDNVQGLLESSLHLLDTQENGQYAAGLYMYAVEEFGKAVLLKEYATENKKNHHIPAWILGIGNPKLESVAKDAILRKLLRNLIPNPSRLVVDNRKLRKILGQQISYSERNAIEEQLARKITSHNAKLLIGFNKLPSVCSDILRGVKITTPFTSNKVVSITSGRRKIASSGPYRKVFIESGMTGQFWDAINTDLDVEDLTFIDLDLKEACFYMD